jgi:hypothetical protein
MEKSQPLEAQIDYINKIIVSQVHIIKIHKEMDYLGWESKIKTIVKLSIDQLRENSWIKA